MDELEVAAKAAGGIPFGWDGINWWLAEGEGVKTLLADRDKLLAELLARMLVDIRFSFRGATALADGAINDSVRVSCRGVLDNSRPEVSFASLQFLMKKTRLAGLSVAVGYCNDRWTLTVVGGGTGGGEYITPEAMMSDLRRLSNGPVSVRLTRVQVERLLDGKIDYAVKAAVCLALGRSER